LGPNNGAFAARVSAACFSISRFRNLQTGSTTDRPVREGGVGRGGLAAKEIDVEQIDSLPAHYYIAPAPRAVALHFVPSLLLGLGVGQPLREPSDRLRLIERRAERAQIDLGEQKSTAAGSSGDATTRMK